MGDYWLQWSRTAPGPAWRHIGTAHGCGWTNQLWRSDVDDQATMDALRAQYPYGHPDFIPMTVAEMELHSRKNHDYARGGSPLGNFDRRAALYRNYPGLDLGNPCVVALVDAMKQLDAALWMLSQGYEGAVEGLEARLGDVSVYAKIARLIYREQHRPAP